MLFYCQEKRVKCLNRYEDKPYKVVRKRGTSVMLRSNNGHIIYRNVSHVRPYLRTFERYTHCGNREHIVRARPHRLRKMPDQFNDFVI